MIGRREFITLLGGAAAAWPLAANAQQRERVRRIGLLISTPEDDTQTQHQVEAFRAGLRELGWIEGRNININGRFAADDPDRLKAFVAELIALKPDVILASGPTPVLAVQRETRTIPIVFAQVNDPVGAGLVATLAQPGGNVTGFAPAEFSIGGKLLEVLKDLAPPIASVGAILDTRLTDQSGMWQSMEAVAPSLGVRLQQLGVPGPDEIEHVVGAFARNSNGGMIVLANRVTITHRRLIIAAAAKHHLPTIYSYRYFVTEGGLVSYGVDLIGLYRKTASYVDRILKGEKPEDLPVQQPTRYELVMNLRTAKSLGLTVPPTLLARADEVIE